MARELKNCFVFGRIGMSPARLVYYVPGETSDAPKPPPPGPGGAEGGPEAKDKPKSALESDIAAAREKLDAAIIKITKDIEAILNNPSSSPAKKAAAAKAQAELAKIQGTDADKPNASPETMQTTLTKVQVILEYYEKVQPVEKKTMEYKALLDSKLPWVKKADETARQIISNWQAAGIDQAIIDRYSASVIGLEGKYNDVLSNKFPKIYGKETLTLEAYATNRNSLTEFSKGLDAEKKLLSDPKVLEELETDRGRIVDGIGPEMLVLNAEMRLDAGKDAGKTDKTINNIYNFQKNRWTSFAQTNKEVDLTATLAKIQSLCLDAKTQASKATGENAALLRSMIIARLTDQIRAFTDKLEKPAYIAVQATSKQGNLNAAQAKDIATQLGISEQELMGANTPPPAPGGVPVLPPAATGTAQERLPANVKPEMIARLQQLNNPELAQMVVGAPGEYREALAKIAEGGERKGESISFKLVFNKTFYECFFIKEGDGNYKINLLDPSTKQMSNIAPFKTKEQAMMALKDGVVTQMLVMKALLDPQYYKHYEKAGSIDMKGEAKRTTEIRKGADPWEVSFRLDWAGLSDVTGNAKVTARAMPYGAIGFTVERSGVGLRGESMRQGLASSVGDFFRQLEHLQKWAENFKDLARKPGWDQGPEMRREFNFSQLNSPDSFFMNQDRLGRPVYFGINPTTAGKPKGYEGDVDMVLDWGGGATNDRDVNPTVRMRLQPDGTINYVMEYRNTKILEASAPNVQTIIEMLAAKKAQIDGQPYRAPNITQEQIRAHYGNPLAAPPVNFMAPAAMPAQPGAAPGGAPPSAVAQGQQPVGPMVMATDPSNPAHKFPQEPQAVAAAAPQATAGAPTVGPATAVQGPSTAPEQKELTAEQKDVQGKMAKKIVEVVANYEKMTSNDFVAKFNSIKSFEDAIRSELLEYAKTLPGKESAIGLLSVKDFHSGIEFTNEPNIKFSSNLPSQIYREKSKPFADALDGRINVMLQNNNKDGALKLWEEAQGKAYNLSGRVCMDIGNIYKERNQPKEALKAFMSAFWAQYGERHQTPENTEQLARDTSPYPALNAIASIENTDAKAIVVDFYKYLTLLNNISPQVKEFGQKRLTLLTGTPSTARG